MSWSTDVAGLIEDVFAHLGEDVRWPGGTVTRAIIRMRQDPRLFETTVTEPVWTIEFPRGSVTPARGMVVTRISDASQWTLGERSEQAGERTDTWTIRA